MGKYLNIIRNIPQVEERPSGLSGDMENCIGGDRQNCTTSS
jgi:hypothetical protein